MSLHCESPGLMAIARLDEELGEFATTITDSITPHSVMEHLTSQCKDGDLTILGKLIRDHLGDSTTLQQVCWIVFHFAFPHFLFGNNETLTRNWIAINKSQQELLNCVHMETIGLGTEHISVIYAPSVVAGKLKANNPEHSDRLLSKWWLYKLEKCSTECIEEELQQCRNTNIMCFFESTAETITVLSCPGDHSHNYQEQETLGRMLGGEDESVVRDRYNNFAKLIQRRDKTNTEEYHGDAVLKCTHYARIPFFFHKRKYMTEAYVAFNASNICTVVTTLRKLESLLRLCVSLINSHVAYASGEKEGKLIERFLSVSRVSHAVSTPLRTAAAITSRIPDAVPQKKELEKQLTICRNLEQFTREVVIKRSNPNRLSASLLHDGAPEEFCADLNTQLEDICHFLEDAEMSPAGPVGGLVKGQHKNLYELCKTNLSFPPNVEHTTISWNKDHMYLMADGLLSNALKYHSLKYGDRAMKDYRTAKSLPYLTVYLTLEAVGQNQGIFLMVENDSLYDSNKIEDAQKEAENLTKCTQVDWIGVSLLHMASEAMGYKTPKWEAIDSRPFVRLRASGQIGLIKTNDE